jgi:hypothetical protein
MINFALRFLYSWKRDPVTIKWKAVKVACLLKKIYIYIIRESNDDSTFAEPAA